MRIILVQSEGKLHGTGHRTFHSVGLQSDQPTAGRETNVGLGRPERRDYSKQ